MKRKWMICLSVTGLVLLAGMNCEEPVPTPTPTPTENGGESLGWTHQCTIICQNKETGTEEQMERLGANNDFTTVCKETRLTCEAGRSAACVNAAKKVNIRESARYSDCVAGAFHECTQSCGFE